MRVVVKQNTFDRGLRSKHWLLPLAMPAMLSVSDDVLQHDLASLVEQQQANTDLQRLLKTLPDCIKHPVMVPFGPVAFFSGHLIHTNECLVDIGNLLVKPQDLNL